MLAAAFDHLLLLALNRMLKIETGVYR